MVDLAVVAAEIFRLPGQVHLAVLAALVVVGGAIPFYQQEPERVALAVLVVAAVAAPPMPAPQPQALAARVLLCCYGPKGTSYEKDSII